MMVNVAVQGTSKDDGEFAVADPHRPDLIVIGADYKAARWREESACAGYSLVPVRTAAGALKHLFRSWRNGTRPAVLFRYLNDIPDLRATLVKAALEVGLVMLSFLSRSRVYWICHNIDRETDVHHPRITAFRRWVVGTAANTIFVTDPLLLPHARRLLPKSWSRKLSWICFGSYESWGKLEPWGDATEPEVRARVEAFVARIRQKADAVGKSALIGLCLGRPGRKYLHYDYAARLLQSASLTRFHLALIVAVDMKKASEPEQRRRIKALRNEANVLLFERPVGFHEAEMAHVYDFVWRSCADWSTPVTAYGAASAGKPLLSIHAGFLPELVREYELGAVVAEDMSDIDAALNAIADWEPDGSHRFLAERGWKTAAARLTSRLDRTSRRSRSTSSREG
jgi:glycosyltransferase involved in cell wall biosynthesis